MRRGGWVEDDWMTTMTDENELDDDMGTWAGPKRHKAAYKLRGLVSKWAREYGTANGCIRFGLENFG